MKMIENQEKNHRTQQDSKKGDKNSFLTKLLEMKTATICHIVRQLKEETPFLLLFFFVFCNEKMIVIKINDE